MLHSSLIRIIIKNVLKRATVRYSVWLYLLCTAEQTADNRKQQFAQIIVAICILPDIIDLTAHEKCLVEQVFGRVFDR